MKRQAKLEKAKIEMKALLERVIEAESHLSKVKQWNKKASTTAISNGQVSTTEDQSHLQSSQQVQ
jgi:hypothetical protein